MRSQAHNISKKIDRKCLFRADQTGNGCEGKGFITLRITGPSRILNQRILINNDFWGHWVHIAFAIIFFLFVGLCETLRHGVFGLSPSETNGIIYATLALSALVLLRGDVIFTLIRPTRPLYGNARATWNWPRTGLGLFLGPLLWVLPVAYGFALIQINVTPTGPELLIRAVGLHLLTVGIAEALFFREAVLKTFNAEPLPVCAISTLAVFIFHMPSGVPLALIAAGSGLYFLTLRLIGCNILVTALLHSATVVLFGQVLSLGLTEAQLWTYAGYFLPASAALSLCVYVLFTGAGKEARYA